MTPPTGGRRAEVTDPDGHRVVLTEERWGHILVGHPEIGPLEAVLLATVASPTRRLAGRIPREQWYYLELERPRPSRWLKVVVSYGEQEGRIVTAFLRRSLP